jgi:hypothetical protein
MSEKSLQSGERLAFGQGESIVDCRRSILGKRHETSRRKPLHGGKDAAIDTNRPARQGSIPGVMRIERRSKIFDIQIEQSGEGQVEELGLALKKHSQQKTRAQLAGDCQLIDQLSRIAGAIDGIAHRAVKGSVRRRPVRCVCVPASRLSAVRARHGPAGISDIPPEISQAKDPNVGR